MRRLALAAALLILTLSSGGVGLSAVRAAAPQLLVFQATNATADGIFVSRLDGSDRREVTPAGANQGYHPDWSPDGKRIVFADQVRGIWTVNVDGSGAKLVYDCAASQCDYPAWSPDGGRIAFTLYLPAKDGKGPPRASSIVVLDLESERLARIVSAKQPKLVDVPRWAPDGSRLVYGIDLFGNTGDEVGSAIAVVPVTGGPPRVLTAFNRYAYYPDWNRATGSIVFSIETVGYASAKTQARHTVWNLYTIKPDGSKLRQLTHVKNAQHVWQPSWTPDGSRITATLDPGRSAVFVSLPGKVSKGLFSGTHNRLQPKTP